MFPHISEKKVRSHSYGEDMVNESTIIHVPYFFPLLFWKNKIEPHLVLMHILYISQGLLNQMDRTLSTKAKFESSDLGLILGTQFTPHE